MNILVIIPARGGSKGIPGKNTKLLNGKPLISYPIELAKSIKEINKIIVSTDSKEIASMAKRYGAEVPFIRPAELAKDETPTLPVLRHCVKFLEGNQRYRPDLVLTLFPTCPFLKKTKAKEALNLLVEMKYNSVISVSKDWGRYWIDQEGNETYKILYPPERINRQYYTPLHKENGAIYFSNYETIMVKNLIVDDSSVGFVIMEEDEVIDIDKPSDWEKAEIIAKKWKL